MMTKLNSNSGIILVTVLLVSIVMAVVAIGILSLNVGQVKTSVSSADHIKAQQLAIGYFYRYHQLRAQNYPNPPCTTAGNPATCPTSFQEVLDGKTFTITLTVAAHGTPGCDSPNDLSDCVETAVTY